MQRRTKIVATLGPATDDPAVLAGIVEAGIDVARVNFSHGSYADHTRRIDSVRAAARIAGREVGILADLGGPKIRIESFREGRVELVEGQHFALDTAHDPAAGTVEVVGVAYKELTNDVRDGDSLLINDGQIVVEVERVSGTRIDTVVRVGGELSNRKGLNRKGGGISAPALTDKDREDIRFASSQLVDYLAVSFARDADDINQARLLLKKARGNGRIVAKIERHEAIDNLGHIIDASDVVMVARGDLGVEMGYAELTGLQKTIIFQSRQRNRVVITATQMMESMIQNPIPTRAEVSDVSNAVMDGTDAVMLSAESAAGKHPVKAVQAMADVIVGAEKYQLSHSRTRNRAEGQFARTDEAIAMAVMYTANHMRLRAIVALTETGSTPLWMSRIRSDIPIYAFTPHEATRRRVTLYRGVYPVSFNVPDDDPKHLQAAVFAKLFEMHLVTAGDLVIVTQGALSGISGSTNSFQILKVPAPAAA